MKTIWNAISFLAAVNLLALALFAGWLWQTGRLNRDRIDAARALFSPTIDETAAGEKRLAEAEALARRERAEQARRDNPPLPSAARVELLAQVQEEGERSARRLEEVQRQLLGQLDVADEAIEAQRAALEAQRERWRVSVETAQQRKTDEQFRKAVTLLEALPPKQAKKEIIDLVGTNRVDQAVAYLDAMSARARGKLMAEFKSDQEVRLATELLERLRTFGLPEGETDAAKASTDADTPSSTG